MKDRNQFNQDVLNHPDFEPALKKVGIVIVRQKGKPIRFKKIDR